MLVSEKAKARKEEGNLDDMLAWITDNDDKIYDYNDVETIASIDSKKIKSFQGWWKSSTWISWIKWAVDKIKKFFS